MPSILGKFISIGALLLVSHFSGSKEKVVVATEIWGPVYIIEGGGGLYEDIVREVYSDYEVEFIYEEYLRTIALVKNQYADLWLGSYIAEEAYAAYPETPMDYDEVVSLSLKTKDVSNKSYADANLVWMKGYQYDIHFPDLSLTGYEVRSIETAIKLLENGKADMILGDIVELEEGILKAGYSPYDFKPKFLGLLGLYPGFMKSEKSQKLIDIWDQRMQELLDNGKLKALFAKFGLEGEYYHPTKFRTRPPVQSAQ